MRNATEPVYPPTGVTVKLAVALVPGVVTVAVALEMVKLLPLATLLAGQAESSL